MALLTQKQKNRINAMSADGASVDDIAAAMSLDTADVESVLGHREKSELDGFEAVEVKQRKGRWSTAPISEEKREEVRQLISEGLTIRETAMLSGVSMSSVSRIMSSISRIKSEIKEKEPAAAGTATDSDVKTLQVQNITESAESQALRGVNVLGVLQAALENAYGNDAEIMSLKADSDTASVMFKYGEKAYSLQFGLAF